VFNWFNKNTNTKAGIPPVIDIHSHLLSNLDDGVQSLEEAEKIILRFQKLGYKKLITTPHVMSDSYRNSNQSILEKCTELQNWLTSKSIAVEIQAAAEYYLDEDLMRKLESDEPILTFGNRYLLFETNFMTEPMNLKEFIFLATTKGYKPVLAHPERYIYLQTNFDKLEDILNRGVLFQINISSISGYYSKAAKKIVQKLIDRGWVHLLGSDCHNELHIQLLEKIRHTKYFQKAISLPLLNNSL
jgi:protein-tyrosine phosphatase